jgi:galactokinase
MDLTYASLEEQFYARFNLTPVLFRSPGRINLIGEHTDYNDGFVMPAAIDKEIIFAMALSDEGTTAIHSINMNETVNIDLDRVAKTESPGWFNYLLGIVARLIENGYTIKPFKCSFGGNIPQGAGLSSSAALECGFIYGLNAVNGFGIDANDMIHIAQWSEHHYAGVKCGIMDQFASVMGRKDHVLLLDCRTFSHRYIPLQLGACEIILVDSKVKHSLASSAYNTRREECEEGVRILSKHFPAIHNLRDITPRSVRSHQSHFPDNVYKRCLYVTEEIERVQSAAQDLERGDLKTFGKKMIETHRGLSALYEVSCPELDFLVNQMVLNPNVIGARMMGGGFGGCVIAIVRSSARNEIEDEMYRKYSDRFSIVPDVYEVAIADGVSKIG